MWFLISRFLLYHATMAMYCAPVCFEHKMLPSLVHLSNVSGTGGRAGDPREIDPAKSSLGQRFDRQLHPANREIDNPREN